MEKRALKRLMVNLNDLSGRKGSTFLSPKGKKEKKKSFPEG